MKICYIISNINTKNKGNGGHYYSLISTANAMNKSIDITILNIGTHKSMALENSNIIVKNIISKKKNVNNLFSLLKLANEFFINESFDIIHAFDDLAYFYGRIISFKLKIPIILTKCGGPNPKVYYPFSKDLVVYSEENMSYFRSNKKYRKSNIHLIPNRINSVPQDIDRVNKLVKKYNLDSYEYVLLRIARIGTAYKKSIQQIIEVKKQLSKDISAAVLIIGSVENEKVFNEINKSNIPDLFIETDDVFTKKASELITVGDIILGTGRSFMEASVNNKLMLAPISNSDYPVIVDKENFNFFSAYNFSPRAELNFFCKRKESAKMNKLLKNRDDLNNFIKEHNYLFKSNFQLDYVSDKYIDLYKNLKFNSEFKILDTLLNFIFLLKVFFQNRV